MGNMRPSWQELNPIDVPEWMAFLWKLPWLLDESRAYRQEADWGGQEPGVGDRELALNVDRGSVLKDEKYFWMW